jgi:hypothetical protein
MCLEEHATPIVLGEFPQLAALEVLDAALDAATRAMAAGHPDLGATEGAWLSDDDPPLPWIAADLLDQVAALQGVLHRYHQVALGGGSCCRRCAVRQRAVGCAAAGRKVHDEEA